MIKNPKVSIMIPTYNQEAYISQAIESALMQDYNNIEIIISDDCSTDRTEEIAKRYLSDYRVKYYRNNTNLGRVKNYHHTLYDLTSGEWVINLDGDDYYTDKSFISRAMDHIFSQENVVCYFGNRNLTKNLDQYSQNIIGKDTYLFNGIFYFTNYFRIGGFAHMSTLYKKNIAIKDQKCYTFNGNQSDFHGIIRMCIYGNIIIAKETGYKWRAHGNNASISIDFNKKYLDELACQRLILADLGFTFLTEEQKKEWLKEGQKWAYRDYITNLLIFRPSLKSLLLGFRNFRFNRSYAIIICKATITLLQKGLQIS